VLNVLVAGATGAIGRRLIPRLLASGHQVTGLTRSPAKAAALRDAGALPVVADALDRTAVERAVKDLAPDVVIHELTDLGRMRSFRNFDVEFATTNRLRTAGTDNLLAAARAAGARRFIAQSYGGWIFGPGSTALATEQDPLDPHPLSRQKESLAAIRHLEEAVAEASDLRGVALRYGSFYGPGTGIAADGDIAHLVRRRQLPVVGDGAGVWSFLHVEDAATATIAAMERDISGVYHVCDDEPAQVSAWLPALAEALGAPLPRHIPAWLARLLIGEVGVAMMTRVRGMSNAKAKRDLGWTPSFGSWREGFRTGLG